MKTITPLQFSSPWTPPRSCLCHTLLQALLGLKHVLFKLIALKFSMRLSSEAFKKFKEYYAAARNWAES